MRWSIIRLIWLRELRDQRRDRRTLFMIAVLPLLLYPVLGYAVLKFATGFVERPGTVGVVTRGAKDFPPRTPDGAGLSWAPVMAWFALAPADPATLSVPAGAVGGAASMARVGNECFDFPLLVSDGR